ncbi:MAG: SDR family oxidoreductase [Burkholderiaceae bacterium]
MKTRSQVDCVPAIPKGIHELMRQYDERSRKWLVTGAAGFIGSHLVDTLIREGQRVIGVDNFVTGSPANLTAIDRHWNAEQRSRFRFIQADIASCEAHEALIGVELVLHQAALGSVPRSIERPLDSFQNNVDGFFKFLIAAKNAGVSRFVYASSSSVYGDHQALPKREDIIGKPLSPYAATKLADELFASVIARCYSIKCVGLRYFNVFGPRQDPEGPYAAVIPRWIAAIARGTPPVIYGDGSTSRDFCYVANVVQANLRAALMPMGQGGHDVFNVALGQRTSLLELFEAIRQRVAVHDPRRASIQPEFGPFRAGDVHHSLADISHIQSAIGYQPTHDFEAGLTETVDAILQQEKVPRRQAAA